MDRLDWIKGVLDQGKQPDIHQEQLIRKNNRKTWRKIPQRGTRKNEPYPEHSLSQLRDDPEGNEY